jgi:ankyrin repeat protein
MRLKATAVLLFLATALSAQAPADDRAYQAIRTNDLEALQELVAAGRVNAKDALGQTPLMLAAAFGTVDAMHALLNGGADARATSNSGVTALHWAATNFWKTSLLLGAGADVNVATQLGRTPLMIAASAHGTAPVVGLLLSKGADVNAADTVGVTPLIAAAAVDNDEAARLILGRGASVNAAARIGQSATPLIGAAYNGNVPLMRLLLDAKADVKAISADRAGNVKNGAVMFGKVTALHMAVSSGNADAVRLMLDSGADVNALDVRGMTPLVWSIATDRPNARIVRALVEHGAKASIKTNDGEDAHAWARKFNNPPVLKALGLQPAPMTAAAPAPPSAPAPREAVARSLPLLQLASSRMMTGGGCAACHAQPLSAVTVDLARKAGWTDVLADADVQQVSASLAASAPALLEVREGGGTPDTQVYLAMALASHGTPATRGTDALAHFLAAKQRPDGSWNGVGATRAPIQDGDFSRTAMAIRALAVYGTPARLTEYRERVGRAATWLAAQTPVSTEDRVMQLLGLQWAGLRLETRHARSRELAKLQRPDGGWAQTPFLASDAYATGQVLYTLHQMGGPAQDPGLQRGVAFLTRTQQQDGSWHVKSRAMKIQPYFESGFPHGHDQWISQAATSWAAMALASVAVDQPPATAAVGPTAFAPRARR